MTEHDYQKDLSEREYKFLEEIHAQVAPIVVRRLDELNAREKKIDEFLEEFMRTGATDYDSGIIISFDRREVVRDLVELYHFKNERSEIRTVRARLVQVMDKINRIRHREEQDKLDFDRIKEIPIRNVMSRYGVEVNSHGLCLCPLHMEDTPSCRVYDSTNSFYCFGCHKGGSPIDLVMQRERCDIKEAANLLLTM